jgi:hypothetical protein
MPANPLKGEVSFELVSGEAYTLQFTIDAVCTLEDLLDKSSMEIATALARGRIGTLRAAMWAGLQAHHKISVREAGELIPQIKGEAKALQLVTRAMNLAFGGVDETEEAAEDGKVDPPADGTGPASSEAGAA